MQRVDMRTRQLIEAAINELKREGQKVTGPAVLRIVEPQGGPTSISTIMNYLEHIRLEQGSHSTPVAATRPDGPPMPAAELLTRARDAMHRQVDVFFKEAVEAIMKSAADSVAVMQNALTSEIQARTAAEGLLQEQKEVNEALVRESQEAAVRAGEMDERLMTADVGLARTEAKLAEALARIAAMDHEADAHRKAMADAEGRINALVADSEGLRSDLAGARADRAELQRRLDALVRREAEPTPLPAEPVDPASETRGPHDGPRPRKMAPLRAPATAPAISDRPDTEAT